MIKLKFNSKILQQDHQNVGNLIKHFENSFDYMGQVKWELPIRKTPKKGIKN